jgi:hypothetical protein
MWLLRCLLAAACSSHQVTRVRLSTAVIDDCLHNALVVLPGMFCPVCCPIRVDWNVQLVSTTTCLLTGMCSTAALFTATMHRIVVVHCLLNSVVHT